MVEDKKDAELKLYRAVINNIKNTLYQIKSYNKVTLMSDPKASYFTIVDAVLSGPQEINQDDLVEILGVSHNTLARVRRLGERVENEARSVADAQVRSRRASGQTPAGYLSNPEGGRTSRRRSSAAAPTNSRRSSKRSVSAQPLAKEEEVDYVDLDARDGVMRHLKDQFHSYSRLGDRRSDGSHISCSQSDKWLKRLESLMARILTPVDTTILWKRLCKTNIWMNFPTWLKYVEELAVTRGLDIHDVREALILCGKPSRPSLPFDKSALTTRLTDTSRYGGTHRQRFDSNGQGLGVAGRRDIRDLPMLWPQPTSDGFIMTCPSVLKAGREGATSPNGLRKNSKGQSYCPI